MIPVPSIAQPSRAAVASEALAAALALHNEWQQATVLSILAGRLADDEQARAFTAAHAMRSEQVRVECLADLARALAPAEQATLAEALLAALPPATGDSRTRLVCRLVPLLAPERRAAVAAATLPDVGRMPDEMERGWRLASLAAGLPEPGRLQALALARAIAQPGARVHALAALLDILPAPLQASVRAEATALAHAQAEPDSRAYALVEMMGGATGADRLPLAQAALASAAAAGDWRLWANIVGWLGWVNVPLPAAALTAASAQAAALTDGEARASALTALVSQQRVEGRAAAAEQALAAITDIDEVWVRAGLLSRLAALAPAALRAPILAHMQALPNPWARARALSEMAHRLPPAERQPMLLVAVTAARACPSAYQRARALGETCHNWTD